jgi:serine protease Do
VKAHANRVSLVLVALALSQLVLHGEETRTMTLDVLRSRQEKIQAAVEKAMPCIVAITSEQPGGTGSGVVVSKDGLVLTAAHVTEATGEKLLFIFPDGTRCDGEALGANRTVDAGLARITTSREDDWPFVEMATSDSVEMGSWCLALGHPGGFIADRKPPVRTGRVWHRDYDGALYSDCALIGGDSGGPLFDLEGDVIGIHSSIGGSLATNRHVGSDTFKLHWDRMLKGEVWGEVLIDPDDAERAAMGVELDSTSKNGAGIRAVRQNSPASSAGIKEGDTIIQFAGEEIDSSIRLLRQLAEMKSGDHASVSVQRGDKVLELEVTLVDSRALSEPPDTEEVEPVGSYPFLGIEVETAGDSTESDRFGALVTMVVEPSPAASAGLKVNDVVLSVDHAPVSSPEALADLILQRVPGESITLLVRRGSEELSIQCSLGRL